MPPPPTSSSQSNATSHAATVRARWVKRSAFLVAAVAAAAFLFRDTILGAPVEVHEVTRGDLVQTVVASGRVATPQRVSVGTVLADRVMRIPVEEGQAVRRGDVLIVLDDRDERAAVAQAQAAVGQAEAKLRQLREVGLPGAEQALRQAQANLLLARQQYDRSQDLIAKGFVSQAAMDDAKRNLDVAESQLAAAQVQVRTNSAAGSDFLLAETALSQARASLRVAEARLEQTVIAAPVDGTLIGRNVEPGDVAQPGKELMVLSPAGETQIVVQIDEKNLSQLRIGQKALASADAYPRERFPAELFYINPGVDALRGSVEVKLRVPKPPAYLRQDMTVSVDIDVARRADALTIPAGGIFDAASARPWVLAVEGGHAVRRIRDARCAGRRPHRGVVRPRAGRPGRRDYRRGHRGGTARARGRRRTEHRALNPFAYFEWIVAFRFMREGLTQTLLIIFGVALGGGVIIFMSALLAGLQANVVRRTLNYQAPIQILAPDQVARSLRADEPAGVAAQVQPRSQQLRSVDQWQKFRAEVERIPDVIGVAPVVTGPGFVRRGEATKAVSIIGIEPESYFDVIALPEKMVAGRHDVGPTDVVIGTELAQDLGTNVGDKLGLATANGSASTLTVIGIFDFGNKGANERNVYVALRTAQNLLDLAGGATSIEVKVRDPFAAETVAQTIRESGDLRVDSWIKTNAQFFSAMAAQILANTLIRIFVGLTVALGIASVLVVSVVQKSKEIGILRAMGTARCAGAARVPDPGRLHGARRHRCSDRCSRGASCSCGAASRRTPTARRCSSS